MTRLPVVDDFGADDVRRHQIGRELDAVEAEIDGVGEGLDQQRLGEPRHPAQQTVAAREERDEDLAHQPLLADDRLGEFALAPRRHLGRADVDRSGLPCRLSLY